MNDDSHFYLSKQINNVDLAEKHIKKEGKQFWLIFFKFIKIKRNYSQKTFKNVKKLVHSHRILTEILNHRRKINT